MAICRPPGVAEEVLLFEEMMATNHPLGIAGFLHFVIPPNFPGGTRLCFEKLLKIVAALFRQRNTSILCVDRWIVSSRRESHGSGCRSDPMVQSLSDFLEDVIALLRQRNTCSLCSPVEACESLNTIDRAAHLTAETCRLHIRVR